MAPHGSGLSEARVACDFRTRPNCEFLASKQANIAAASSTDALPFVSESVGSFYKLL